MVRKVYRIPGGGSPSYAIGSFDRGELLSTGARYKSYKTRKGAERALKKYS